MSYFLKILDGAGNGYCKVFFDHQIKYFLSVTSSDDDGNIGSLCMADQVQNLVTQCFTVQLYLHREPEYKIQEPTYNFQDPA